MRGQMLDHLGVLIDTILAANARGNLPELRAARR